MPKKIDAILAEGLKEKGLVAPQALDAALKEIEASGEGLQQFLVRRGLAPEKEILDIYAQKLKLACLNLKTVSVDKKILERIPVKIASYYKFVPVNIKDRVLTVAVSSPIDIKTQDEIRAQLGLDVEVVLSCGADISENLKKYYGLATETIESIAAASGPSLTENIQERKDEKIEDIEKLAGDASVIKLVNQIILEAWRRRATDIHIEPYRQAVALRYRIDGLLYDVSVSNEIKNFLSAIISRIKIISNLNIVEKRLPQDGRAIVKVGENMLDLRISTIPTPFGESVVVRILPTQMLFSLEKLGLAKRDLQILETLIQKPHGIIFVTGPTGSGKTTTLYTCLNRLNTKNRKIITLEDPIEYEMAGITQIQVMPDIGLDFARGLRSILRHDPDVIMVGEVRDLETAETAIRVALTGHLVFSTLHTNDAPSSISRLIDIGVEPYLLSSSVEAFLAQRLIRLICSDCKYEDNSAPRELKGIIAKDLGLKSLDEVKVYRARGCSNCNFTGFFGRLAIYEVLLMDEVIQDLVIKKMPAEHIKRVALSRGMRTLRQDGWQKVVSGLTTPEEVMRVTPSEEHERKTEYPASSLTGGALDAELAEKRIYRRIDAKINVNYKVFKSHAELEKRGFSPEQLSITQNISAGGLLFFADEALAVGSVLELELDLPDGEKTIECLARVVRVEEMARGRYNIAVCFLDIASAERVRLDKYMEKG